MVTTPRNGRCRRLIGVVAMGALLFTGPVGANDSISTKPNWRTEVPSPVRDFQAGQEAVAVDADGDPHVAYGKQELIYAHRSGNAWTIEVADSTLGCGVNADLELDAAGSAHIAHLDQPDDRILYTTNATGPWTTEVVDTVAVDVDFEFNSSFPFTLALAPDGAAHVAYHDPSQGALRYANNRSGTWSRETIDDEGSGLDCDIVVDGAGGVHVAYTKEGLIRADFPQQKSLTLRYASDESGRWRTELVDAGTRSKDDPIILGAGESCSIDVDDLGTPHIAYRDEDGNDGFGAVFHTTNASGRWTRTQVGGTSIFGGGNTRLAVDAAGVVHVIYGESAGTAYSSDAGGSFSAGVVITGPAAEAGLAVTPAGSLVVVHNVGLELAVTTGTPGTLVTDTFDRTEIEFSGQRIDTDPAGNAYYTHSRIEGLLLTDNSSGTWQTDLIDADFSGVGGHLVVDDSGDAHVVYERRPGATSTLVYATNASGSWVRSTIDVSPDRFEGTAFVLDEAGAAHVIYGNDGTEQVRYSTNATGGFVDVLVASLPPFESAFVRDVALDPGGAVHTAWGESGSNDVVYATDASGVWTTEIVVQNVGFLFPFVSLDVDSEGVPHLAYEATDDEFTFYGRIFYGTRGPAGWDIDLIIPTPAFNPGIEIDVNDNVHMSWDAGDVAFADVGYATNQSGSWQFGVFDKGGLGARAFPASTFTAREGDTEALIPIAPVGRIDVTGADIAVTPDCTVHMIYADLTLGNTKYAVQTATVPVPVATVALSTSNGTATSGADYTATNFTARWAADETGSRFAVIPLSDDADVEGTETVRLTLSSPTGDANLGSPSTATLLILDDDATPAGAEDAFILPKNVNVKLNSESPSKSKLVAVGFFDTGTGPVDLTGPATLTVGGLTVSVDALTPKGKGFRLNTRGVDFTITPTRAGSSRAKFKMKMKRDLDGLVDPVSPVRLRFRAGSVDGRGEVLLTNGRYSLGKQRGTLVTPTVFPFKSKAGIKGGGRDTLSIQAGLATLGDTPGTAPTVRIAFGTAFEQVLEPGDFKRKGDKFVFKGPAGGLTSVVLDYGKEKLTAKGKGTTSAPSRTAPSRSASRWRSPTRRRWPSAWCGRASR